MPTLDPRSGASSFPQAEQYPDYSMREDSRTTASQSSGEIIAPTPSFSPASIHAMGRHAPPSLQNYITSSRSSSSTSSASMSGQDIQHRVLEGLREFNNDPEILYMFELRQRPDASWINTEITEKVARGGFHRPSDDEYVYRGDDPAKALRHLLNIRPLILDCATALHLLVYKVLLEVAGDTRFNAYIKEACNGTLSIKSQEAPPVPSYQTNYRSSEDEQNENQLPQDLQHGDRLWIQGPVDGYAFHPAGETNGFNVLVDISNQDRIVLVGFVSSASPFHGSWTYGELRDLLLKTYNAPLTLRDLAFLHARYRQGSQETAPFSTRSLHDTYEWLKETQPEAMAAASQTLNTRNVDLDQPTALYAPRADGIRGVAQHLRIQKSFSLDNKHLPDTL